MKKNQLGKGIADYKELRAVQLAELEILKKFVEVCDKNGLEYFLEGGTLIGAVRHKGFIPWDDDIDVSMTRKDFDRFLEIGQKEMGDEFFVQYKTTDKNCPFAFIKLRKNNTCFLEWNKRNIKMHHGIFIDIFPYDVLPQTNREAYKQECLNLYNKFLLKYIPDRAMQPQWNIKWIAIAAVRRLLFYRYKLVPSEKIDTQLFEAFTRYKDVEYDNLAYTCHPSSVLQGVLNEYLHKDIFPTKKMEFEGIMLKVPANYDAILKQLYGDYMKLPPKTERVGHRPAHISFNHNFSGKIKKK